MINIFSIFGVEIRILDILDILIAAYLIYFIYKYVKGTAAVNIFIGIILFLLLLTAVTELKMRLLTLMLGSIAGIGLIGLIVIFQPEIRRVLLVIGNRTLYGRFNFFDKYFSLKGIKSSTYIEELCSNIITAIEYMSDSKTGALLIISKTDIPSLINTGQMIDANLNTTLLQTIFYKNSPLHDGAVIIQDDRIVAATCVLPISSSIQIPKELGLRHRAALGAVENHEVLSIVVSEQNGSLSYGFENRLFHGVTMDEMRIRLEKFYNE
ncbi:MAG: diadenylate cyclase [Saprospiraceae bacterium]|jgi:diadenylate cyclase